MFRFGKQCYEIYGPLQRDGNGVLNKNARHEVGTLNLEL